MRGGGGGGGEERVENCQAVYITIQHTLSVTSTDYMTDIVVSLCLCTVLYQTHELLCDSRTRRCFTGFYYWSTTSPNGMLLPSLCHICSAVISALSSSPPFCYNSSVFISTALSALSSSPPLCYICSVFISTALSAMSSSPPLHLLCLHLHRSVISHLSSSPPLYLLCLHLHRSICSVFISTALLYLLCLHLHRSICSVFISTALSALSSSPPLYRSVFNSTALSALSSSPPLCYICSVTVHLFRHSPLHACHLQF